MVVVAIVNEAEKVSQVYVLALVKMNVHVHLYRLLRSDFDLHDNTLVHKNDCADLDLRADVHTEDQSDFGIDAQDANEEAGVDIVLESVREGIAGGCSVTMVVKLDVVDGRTHVGECWHQ